MVVHEKEDRTAHLNQGVSYVEVIINVMGEEEIFKGKWAERKVKQAQKIS